MLAGEDHGLPDADARGLDRVQPGGTVLTPGQEPPSRPKHEGNRGQARELAPPAGRFGPRAGGRRPLRARGRRRRLPARGRAGGGGGRRGRTGRRGRAGRGARRRLGSGLGSGLGRSNRLAGGGRSERGDGERGGCREHGRGLGRGLILGRRERGRLRQLAEEDFLGVERQALGRNRLRPGRRQLGRSRGLLSLRGRRGERVVKEEAHVRGGRGCRREWRRGVLHEEGILALAAPECGGRPLQCGFGGSGGGSRPDLRPFGLEARHHELGLGGGRRGRGRCSTRRGGCGRSRGRLHDQELVQSSRGGRRRSALRGRLGEDSERLIDGSHGLLEGGQGIIDGGHGLLDLGQSAHAIDPPLLEVALNHDAARFLGRPQPDHVAVLEGRLALHPIEVHVEPTRAVGVMEDGALEVHPDPGVDGAHTRQVHVKTAVGVGADQDLVDEVLEVEVCPVEGAPQDHERSKPQGNVGHHSLPAREPESSYHWGGRS